MLVYLSYITLDYAYRFFVLLCTIDFGFARHSFKGSKVETFCGSFAYASPEILRREPYDGYAADVWSMGIILYAMLTYRLPYTETDLVLLSKNKQMKELKFTKDTPLGEI